MALLPAILYQKPGIQAGGLRYLERALTLAAPEGYVQPFLAAGQALIHPLRQAIVQNIQSAYAQKLLQALEEQERRRAGQVPASGNLASPAVSQPGLVEPLTPREQQILRLLGAGLSSNEIAGELILSVSTTRTYIKLLYQKLNAHSREEEVAIGQRLRLV